MSGIFISYRREETAANAGRLRDRLVQEFGEDQVFMDIDTIDLGVDFANAIENAVGAVDVLICVMGTEWLTVVDKNGKRRLDNPMDFIRLEVASALKRDIRVIPVLVGSATMPSADQLPPDLAKLPRRNALHLGDARFHTDADRLIKSVRILMPGRLSRGALSKASGLVKWLGAAGIVLVVSGGAWYAWEDAEKAKKVKGVEEESKQIMVAQADAKRKADLAAKQKAEAKRKAALEAERKAKLEAALAAKQKAQADAKRKADLAAKQKAEAKRKAALEAERKKLAAPGSTWTKQAIKNFKNVAGTWKGSGKSHTYSFPLRLTIMADGSYDQLSGGARYKGTMRIIDGKIQYAGYIVTLYERNGQRRLKAHQDKWTWEARPAN